MAALKSMLSDYLASDEEGGDETPAPSSSFTVALLNTSAAPHVVPRGTSHVEHRLDPKTKEIFYNPTFQELSAPIVGPENPYRSAVRSAPKNVLNGFVESCDLSQTTFENQRISYNNLGYAFDPSDNASKLVGDLEKAEKFNGASLATIGDIPAPAEKRKREPRGDPSDVQGYKGPWRRFEGEVALTAPLEPTGPSVASVQNSKKRNTTVEESSTLHVKDAVDYQGRSFMEPPHDEGVSFGEIPEKFFLPKKLVHTWTGHTKPVAAIRFIPLTAHLLLSAGMDSKIKIWEVYGKRRVLRTYFGHSQAVRDICFSNDGRKFLSCGYDKMVRLWDTETGQVIERYDIKRVPYCVKFHPVHQNQFVTGTADKKIYCYDTTSNLVVQEYDRHLGAVNTISFMDDGKKMVTTSDDKSIRIWEWDIPVDLTMIAEPGMHAVTSAALHPNKKWMIMQAMDNIVHTHLAVESFRENKKKQFRGHLSAGYACETNFSPDGHYVLSGDADGHVFIWDWKSTKIYSKFRAHEKVCNGVQWNPNETSKIATCGWDGLIKYWD